MLFICRSFKAGGRRGKPSSPACARMKSILRARHLQLRRQTERTTVGHIIIRSPAYCRTTLMGSLGSHAAVIMGFASGNSVSHCGNDTFDGLFYKPIEGVTLKRPFVLSHSPRIMHATVGPSAHCAVVTLCSLRSSLSFGQNSEGPWSRGRAPGGGRKNVETG